jgi:hypothetical protein
METARGGGRAGRRVALAKVHGAGDLTNAIRPCMPRGSTRTGCGGDEPGAHAAERHGHYGHHRPRTRSGYLNMSGSSDSVDGGGKGVKEKGRAPRVARKNRSCEEDGRYCCAKRQEERLRNNPHSRTRWTVDK